MTPILNEIQTIKNDINNTNKELTASNLTLSKGTSDEVTLTAIQLKALLALLQ